LTPDFDVLATHAMVALSPRQRYPQQAKLQVGVCWFIEVLVRDSAEPSAQCDLAGASRMATTFA